MFKKQLFFCCIILLGVFVFSSLDFYKNIFGIRYKSVYNIASVQTSVSLNGSIHKLSQKKPLKVLIVPGHEPDFGGAEYKNLKERDIVVDLSQRIADKLKTDSRFDIMLARDTENWNPVLADYFISDADEIKKFITEKKKSAHDAVKKGERVVTAGIEHNAAPQDIAFRLYAINKWASEHGIDVVLHVHLNDYPRKYKDTKPGVYSGFAIYAPESQYQNASSSLVFSSYVFNRLVEKFKVSNLSIETGGIIEDQELIAIGAYGTLTIPSILVEYGYIYEPGITNEAMLPKTLDTYAEATFEGFKDYVSYLSSVI